MKLHLRALPYLLLSAATVAAIAPGCAEGDEGTDGPGDGNSSDAGRSDTSPTEEASAADGGSPIDTGPGVDLCGNSAVDPGEGCDDGNKNPDDGCSAACAPEEGYVCSGAGPLSCRQICGNGTLQSREACDFLSADAGDAASTNPACTNTCSLAEGYSCTANVCTAICGDGKLNGTEACDEGPLNGEPGHCNKLCTATLTPSCGDGRVQAGEGCDDGLENGNVGKCAVGCPLASVPMPAQTSTFSGNVRGYWFTAPKDFVMTTVRVPTDASSGVQSIAIVRFAANPPLFATTTNAFDTLFLAQNSVNSGPLTVKIPVSKDQIIGVLGQRDTVGSYAAGTPIASTLDGLPMPLARLGMQFSLTTTAPKDLWTEASGSISRVDFTYAKSQCGDGVKVTSEGCDDGNLAPGDGCSSTCQVEAGFSCSQGVLGIASSKCTSSCGDGTKASTEGCDDGASNGLPTMCDAQCRGKEVGIGSESAVQTGKSLGYWFTAPSDFVIRGLRVPTTAGAADQAVQVVKFLAAPPTGGELTNNFQSLAYARDVAGTGFVNVQVKVTSGDRIGILGSRGAGAVADSSVSGAPIAGSILGQAVTLNPLAIPGSLGASTAFDLKATTAGVTGRIEMLAGN